MPYKSEAQRRKFHQLLKVGKISPETVAEFDSASRGKKLPERVERTNKSTYIKEIKPIGGKRK